MCGEGYFLWSWEGVGIFILYSSYIRPIFILYRSYINSLEVVVNKGGCGVMLLGKLAGNCSYLLFI